jgi:lysyl-tRNA synthetase class I
MFYTYEWFGELQADQIESSAVKFFSMDELPEVMHPNTLKAVQKFIQFFKTKEISIS